MENNITIEKEPYAETLWFAGIYTDNEGSEWEFSISDRSNGNIPEAYHLEVTWIDGEPGGNDKEIEAIEGEIVRQYQNR